MKCRDCGGDLYHYPGCNIGDHGDLVGDTEGASMPDAPGDEIVPDPERVRKWEADLKPFADAVHASTIITADDMNVRINARDDDPPATDIPAETRDDTARLDWLEAQGCLTISLNKVGQRPEFWDIDQGDHTLGTGATLREAIDAAVPRGETSGEWGSGSG